MSDNRAEDPATFWTDVIGSRLEPSGVERRRRRRRILIAVSTAIKDEQTRLLAIVRQRVLGLEAELKLAEVIGVPGLRNGSAALVRARLREAHFLQQSLKRRAR